MRIVIFVLFVIGLFIVTFQGIVPLTRWFVTSDLGTKVMYKYTPEAKNTEEIPALALAECQNYIKQDLDSTSLAEFPAGEYKSWEVGPNVEPNTYIIQSYVDITDSSDQRVRNKYSCKIQYTVEEEGDQLSWTVLGLDFF
jgi:hypothetical protein